MCWMTIRQEYDALAKGIVETARHEAANGQSWGYCYAEDGELHFEHGLGSIEENTSDGDYNLDIPVTENALVHTRYATRGEVNEENAHPFKIRQDGEVVAALAHNGTWHEAPYHEDKSDTWMMARYFERKLEDYDFETALRKLTDEVGETIVVMRPDGTLYAYHGRFTITGADGVMASSGYSDLPPDTIVKVDPDGETQTVRQTTLQDY